MIRISIIAVLTLLLISASSFAQTEARITTLNVVRGNSNAQFTVSIRCDGASQFDLSRSQLVVTDNGMPVTDFDIIESSSPAVRNPFSAVLVLDASGSMTGSYNAEAKVAGSAFVQFMDGVVDEAAILWFTEIVRLQRTMTTNKVILDSAVQALPANGATAMYDGAWDGLMELQAHGVNQKKAVLLLSDGGDNSSSHTPGDVIQLAQQLNLRVFTIGLGSGINATIMQQIATSTGGSFFQTPNAADLQTIFAQIASFMGRGFEEHTVAFKTPDPDALEHELQISVVACGETAASMHKEAAGTVSGIDRMRQSAPFALELAQNIPNPLALNAVTVIPFSLSGTVSPQPVRLEVFDVLGRRMALLVDSDLLPGNHVARFNADGIAPGMYLYRLSSAGVITTRTMIVR
ncbi:MAG: VWA domain-containing protein [Bacteroidota bacterium]|jgi:VWFA-related protein